MKETQSLLLHILLYIQYENVILYFAENILTKDSGDGLFFITFIQTNRVTFPAYGLKQPLLRLHITNISVDR